MAELITFTADDEDPDCMMCDHCTGDYEVCNECGPQYGWNNYSRTENPELEE